MSILKKINRIIENFERIFLAVMFTIMVAIIAMNVFCRYVLSKPLFWVTEAACYILVYLIFFGASLALNRNEHVKIDMSNFKIPTLIKKIFTVICDILSCCFLVLLVFTGMKLTIENMQSFTGILPVPTATFYAAAPISGIFMLLHYIEVILPRRESKNDSITD